MVRGNEARQLRLAAWRVMRALSTFTTEDLTGGTGMSGHSARTLLRKLEDAGYIACTKSFEDRRPRTAYRITEPGRAALNRYLDHVEAVIRATRG